MRSSRGFFAAAVFGAIHAGFSLYWSVGGTFLLGSLGTGVLETFRNRLWVLVPVGLFKLLAALAPLLLAFHDWPVRRLSRVTCWAGALVLMVWGGLNTVVGNLVLGEVIQPSGGFDRQGMLGHAYLWGPLFLLWGLALTYGLRASTTHRHD